MALKILYIGNDLAKQTGYMTSMETFSSKMQEEGYEIIKYSNKKNKILRLFHMCFGLIKNYKSVDYVLIDTFSSINFYYCLIASQISRILRKKYITILRGGDLPKRINKSIYFSNLIFNNSYKNVAPSYYLKESFEKNQYIVEYIPNILEIENYNFKIRKALQPKLFWVRAFKHLYNPILALNVLKIIKEKYPEATLCMVGPVKDDSLDLFNQKVKELDFENSVEITGVLSKKDWHKKSEEFDIFINTTNFDNTPVSVMEAMALGLPVVSTNVGGMPYLIKNNVDGILVEKDDPEVMSDSIDKLIQSDNSQMILNARSKAESFSWNVVKNQWFQILN